MNDAHNRFPHNTPDTKEAYYIRDIFEKHFPGESAAHTVLKWIPKWQMSKDPSGRANIAHLKSVAEIVQNGGGEGCGNGHQLEADQTAVVDGRLSPEKRPSVFA